MPGDYQVQFEYAQLLLDLGKAVSAVGIANALTLEHPDWLPARMLLARAYWQSDDVLHTIHVLEHLPRERLNAQACLILGQARARLHQNEDAEAYLQLALQRRPGFVSAQRALASLYLETGQEVRAARILEALLEQSPNDYETLHVLARVQQFSGNFDGALEAAKKMAELDPSRPEAFEILGQISLKRSENSSGVSYFEQALSRNNELNRRTGEASVLQQLGTAYSRLEKYPEALASLRRAVELGPPRAAPHYLLGRLLLRMGQTEQGRKELDVARQLSRERRASRRTGMAVASTVPE